jgi:hypothetical protein
VTIDPDQYRAADDTTPSARGAHRPRRGPVWTAALIAIPVLVVAVVAVGGWIVLHRAITVHGAFRLTSVTTGVTRTGTNNCQGANGYSDLQEGTQVTVTDQSGAVVALGTLDVGQAQSDSVCVFPFTLNVPAGKGFYGIEVSHRGVVHLSEAELRAGPQLSLTDTN